MVRTIEYRWNQRVNSHVGPVRLPTTDAVVVPAGQNLVLEGVVTVRGQVTDKWVVMEPHSYSLVS